MPDTKQPAVKDAPVKDVPSLGDAIETDAAGNKSLNIQSFQKALPEAVKRGLDDAFKEADLNKDGIVNGLEAMVALNKVSSLIPAPLMGGMGMMTPEAVVNYNIAPEMSKRFGDLHISQKQLEDFGKNTIVPQLNSLATNLDVLPIGPKGKPNGDGHITLGEVMNSDGKEKIEKTLENIAQEFLDTFGTPDKSVALEGTAVGASAVVGVGAATTKGVSVASGAAAVSGAVAASEQVLGVMPKPASPAQKPAQIAPSIPR